MLLKAAVSDFAQAVEEHGPGQRVAGLALVQPGIDAAAQLHALQPVQHEQRALDAAQLTQGHRQTVLPWVAAQFPQHQRGRHGALLDGRDQAQDFIPMGTNLFDVQCATNHWFKCLIDGITLWDIELGVPQVADARREPKAQEVHQAKDVIGKARRVGVVLLDAQVGLVVQQAIQHIGRVAHADIDHLGAERRVLVGDMGVEGAAWLRSVLWIDVAGALSLAANTEVLPVR